MNTHKTGKPTITRKLAIGLIGLLCAATLYAGCNAYEQSRKEHDLHLQQLTSTNSQLEGEERNLQSFARETLRRGDVMYKYANASPRTWKELEENDSTFQRLAAEYDGARMAEQWLRNYVREDRAKRNELSVELTGKKYEDSQFSTKSQSE
ncbi:MAG: hypothetical protein V1725_04345 [archaeon]